MADQKFREGQRVQLRRAITKSRSFSIPSGEYVIFKVRRGLLWWGRRYRIKSIPDEDIDTTINHKQLVEATRRE